MKKLQGFVPSNVAYVAAATGIVWNCYTCRFSDPVVELLSSNLHFCKVPRELLHSGVQGALQKQL